MRPARRPSSPRPTSSTASDRPFTALVHVEQTGLEAEITGVVIDGWRKGSPVHGTYAEITCDHDGVSTDCWQGSLTIGDADR